MTSTQPEWPAVGDQVAVYKQYSLNASVEFDTVGRLTPARVFLSGGAQFNRATGREVGGDREMLAIDAPRVTAVLARRAIENLRYELDKLFKPGVGSPAGAAHLLDRAEVLIADARRRIAGPSATPTE